MAYVGIETSIPLVYSEAIKELKSIILLVKLICIFINMTTVSGLHPLLVLAKKLQLRLVTEDFCTTWNPIQPAYKQDKAPESYYTSFGQITLCAVLFTVTTPTETEYPVSARPP